MPLYVLQFDNNYIVSNHQKIAHIFFEMYPVYIEFLSSNINAPQLKK